MKRMLWIPLALTLALVPIAGVQAQITPFSVEAEAGVVIPTGDFGDDFATTGFGLGLTAAYRVAPMLDLYAGFSWQRFGAEDDPEFGEFDVDIDDSGFSLGGRLHFPGAPGISPWVRAGVIFHRLKVSGSEGGFSISVESDRTVGFELGGGAAFPVAPRVEITPSLSFRRYTPELAGESDEAVTYLGLGVGARFTF